MGCSWLIGVNLLLGINLGNLVATRRIEPYSTWRPGAPHDLLLPDPLRVSVNNAPFCRLPTWSHPFWGAVQNLPPARE